MHAFVCPHCRSNFRVEPATVGRPTACPTCKKAVHPEAPEPPGGAAAGWHVGRGGKKAGPLTWQQMLGLASAGKIRPEDMVLAPGSPRWMPAGRIHGLLTPPMAKPIQLPVAALAKPAPEPAASFVSTPTIAPVRPIAGKPNPKSRLMLWSGIGGGGALALVGLFVFAFSGGTPKTPPKESAKAKEPNPVAEISAKKSLPQKKNEDPPPDERQPQTKTVAPKEPTTLTLKKVDPAEIEPAFLDAVNRFRRAAGLSQVAYDPMLTKGCRAHAEYLAVNAERPEVLSAKGVQSEVETLPGYSAEGKKAAEASLTALAEPEVALEIFMGRLLSRTPLLNPELQRIGMGAACTSTGEWVCVLDPTRGLGDYLVTYPAPDQGGVPPTFTGGPEWPNPPAAVGYPITVLFPQNRKVRQAEMKLVDASGAALPAKISTPENPLIQGFRHNIVGILPEKPLVSGAKYTVQFSARIDDQPLAKFWSFTADDDSDSSGSVTQQVLDRVNQIRKTAGLDPVALDPELHRGCRSHAKYLVTNAGHPATAGLGAHDEDLKLPGATPEGRDAGKKSVIALGDHDPRDAVEGWMATLYHRVPILEPNLKRVGFGLARGDRLGWITVLNLMSGKSPGRPREVLYPVPGQSDVPLHFPPGGEEPNPIPDDTDKKAGYPITAFFPYDSPLVSSSGKLTEADGTDVPVWFSSPEKLANPKFDKHQGNTVCLIAKDPLKPRTKYKVDISGTRQGKKWDKSWTFVTADAASAEGPKLVIERLNEYRRRANVPEVVFDADLSKGCQAHAEYLARNGDSRGKKGFSVHDEDPAFPGFSEIGQEAARRSDVFSSAPRPTVQIDDLMGTLSRRAYLLDPRLRRVGIGCAQEPGRGWVGVLDVNSGKGEAAVAFYPGSGQQNVPLKGFDRVPGAKEQFAGYPISAVFPRSASVKNVRATLADRNGKTLDIHLSTPDNPLDAGLQYHAVGIHPLRPLDPGQIYSVTLLADVNGRPFQQTWRFETAER